MQLGAPVATVGLVQIVPELVAINPEMAHIAPGLAHGSRFVPDCTECRWIEYVDVAENRPGSRLLAVLYGWMVGAGEAILLRNSAPKSGLFVRP